MSPMYKVTPNRGGNSVRWSKVDTSENTLRLQTIAWLNTPEGKQYLQQLIAKQMQASRDSENVKKGSSPYKANTESLDQIHATLNKYSPRGDKKIEKINENATPQIKQDQIDRVSLISSSNHRLSPDKNLNIQNSDSDTSLSPARSRRLVKNPRLLDENASLFPRPVKNASNTQMIASILEKSLIERQRLESR